MVLKRKDLTQCVMAQGLRCKLLRLFLLKSPARPGLVLGDWGCVKKKGVGPDLESGKDGLMRRGGACKC